MTGRHACVAALMLAAIGSTVAIARTEVDVEAFVRPDRNVRELETVQFVIRVEGSQNAPRVTLTGLQNLRVVGGPGTSRHIESINGRRRESAAVTWTLLPERAGTARIPALAVEVDGRTYETAALEFEVGAAAEGPPVGSGAAPDAGADRSRDGAREPDLFLDSGLAADRVYVGQPVSHTMDLWAAANLTGVDLIDEPAFTGFWVEDDPAVQREEPRRVERNGRAYLRYPIRHKLLVPNRPGTFEIEPYVMRLSYRSPGDRLRFFSVGRTRDAVRRSRAHTLTVLPLPEDGRPEGFDGAVGSFSVSARLDRTEAAVDDAIGLTVEVEGTGFLRTVQPPTIPETPGLKVFPPKTRDRTSIRAGKLVSRKTWEWILVPLQGGELRVPEPVFAYFDPDAGEYRTESATLPIVSVSGSGARSRTGGGAVRELRRDVEFVKARDGRLDRGEPRWHRRPSFLAWTIAPALASLGAIAVGRWRRHAFGDRARRRRRRAASEARRRLAGATGDGMHQAVSRAIFVYVADRFDVEAAGLTHDRIDRLFADAGVDEELRAEVRSLLEDCDLARYGSARAARSGPALRDEATRTIAALERVK